MGCSNGLLLKYAVRIKNEGPGSSLLASTVGNGLLPITQISRVTGLGLGTEGSITLREANRRIQIPDTVRSFPDLGLRLRIDADLQGQLVFQFFTEFWQKRAGATKTIFIDISNRDRRPLFIFTYTGCSMKSYTFEDQELGVTRVGVLNMAFTPYNVDIDQSPESLLLAGAVTSG